MTRLTLALIIILSSISCKDQSQAADLVQPTGAIRSDLSQVALVDGSRLHLFAWISSPSKSETVTVNLCLNPKVTRRKVGMDAKWSNQLTTANYSPERVSYYALAKITNEKLFIFCLWNSRHFNVNMRTGEVLEKGTGDEVLKNFESLVPIKLSLYPPSTGRTVKMSDEEVKEMQRTEVQLDTKLRANPDSSTAKKHPPGDKSDDTDGKNRQKN